MVSWFYGKSRGIKENEKVTIEVHESNSPVPSISIDFNSSKPLFRAEVSPDKSGSIKFKIDWGKIPNGQQNQLKYVYVKVLDNTNNNNKQLYNGGEVISWNKVPLKKSSEVIKLGGYSSAAIVGSSNITGNSNDNKNGVCEAEAKVRAFLRM